MHGINVAFTDALLIHESCCCTYSCVVVAIIPHCIGIIMEFLVVSVDGTCLFVGDHIFSQILSIYAGMHGPLFVATNSHCVHMVLGPLQR